MLCGLRTGGIECGHRRVRSAYEFGWPYEIHVAPDDLDAAREIIATVET